VARKSSINLVANLRDPSALKLAEKSSNPAENLKEIISMIP
jgi:hypothetical protein